jgi:mycofactocin precursor
MTLTYAVIRHIVTKLVLEGADMIDDPTPTDQQAAITGDDDAVVDDVLVEEVSIDGMCGVY